MFSNLTEYVRTKNSSVNIIEMVVRATCNTHPASGVLFRNVKIHTRLVYESNT